MMAGHGMITPPGMLRGHVLSPDMGMPPVHPSMQPPLHPTIQTPVHPPTQLPVPQPIHPPTPTTSSMTRTPSGPLTPGGHLMSSCHLSSSGHLNPSGHGTPTGSLTPSGHRTPTGPLTPLGHMTPSGHRTPTGPLMTSGHLTPSGHRTTTRSLTPSGHLISPASRLTPASQGSIATMDAPLDLTVSMGTKRTHDPNAPLDLSTKPPKQSYQEDTSKDDDVILVGVTHEQRQRHDEQRHSHKAKRVTDRGLPPIARSMPQRTRASTPMSPYTARIPSGPLQRMPGHASVGGGWMSNPHRQAHVQSLHRMPGQVVPSQGVAGPYHGASHMSRSPMSHQAQGTSHKGTQSLHRYLPSYREAITVQQPMSRHASHTGPGFHELLTSSQSKYQVPQPNQGGMTSHIRHSGDRSTATSISHSSVMSASHHSPQSYQHRMHLPGPAVRNSLYYKAQDHTQGHSNSQGQSDQQKSSESSPTSVIQQPRTSQHDPTGYYGNMPLPHRGHVSGGHMNSQNQQVHSQAQMAHHPAHSYHPSMMSTVSHSSQGPYLPEKEVNHAALRVPQPQQRLGNSSISNVQQESRLTTPKTVGKHPVLDTAHVLGICGIPWIGATEHIPSVEQPQRDSQNTSTIPAHQKPTSYYAPAPTPAASIHVNPNVEPIKISPFQSASHIPDGSRSGQVPEEKARCASVISSHSSTVPAARKEDCESSANVAEKVLEKEQEKKETWKKEPLPPHTEADIGFMTSHNVHMPLKMAAATVAPVHPNMPQKSTSLPLCMRRYPFPREEINPNIAHKIPIASVNPIVQQPKNNSSTAMHPKKQMLYQSRLDSAQEYSQSSEDISAKMSPRAATVPSENSPIGTDIVEGKNKGNTGDNSAQMAMPDNGLQCVDKLKKDNQKEKKLPKAHTGDKKLLLYMVPPKERLKAKKIYEEGTLEPGKKGTIAKRVNKKGQKTQEGGCVKKVGPKNRPKIMAPLMKKVSKAMKKESEMRGVTKCAPSDKNKNENSEIIKRKRKVGAKKKSALEDNHVEGGNAPESPEGKKKEKEQGMDSGEETEYYDEEEILKKSKVKKVLKRKKVQQKGKVGEQNKVKKEIKRGRRPKVLKIETRKTVKDVSTDFFMLVFYNILTKSILLRTGCSPW